GRASDVNDGRDGDEREEAGHANGDLRHKLEHRGEVAQEGSPRLEGRALGYPVASDALALQYSFRLTSAPCIAVHSSDYSYSYSYFDCPSPSLHRLSRNALIVFSRLPMPVIRRCTG